MGSVFGDSAIRRSTWIDLAPTAALLLVYILPVSADDHPASDNKDASTAQVEHQEVTDR